MRDIFFVVVVDVVAVVVVVIVVVAVVVIIVVVTVVVVFVVVILKSLNKTKKNRMQCNARFICLMNSLAGRFWITKFLIKS